MRHAVIIKDSIGVLNTLVELGIPVELVREALIESEHARDRYSAGLYPPCFPGIAAWAELVRALRVKLIPLGWTANDDGNFSTIISPDGTIAIAAETGDEITGLVDLYGREPKTKYSKGPATLRAVERNCAQGNLLGINETETVYVPCVEGRQTWALLRNRTGGSIRAELSLPDAIGADGRVKGWARRIILDAVSIEPDPGKLLEDEGEDIDVKVAVKARG